jgi:hypothetical protein
VLVLESRGLSVVLHVLCIILIFGFMKDDGGGPRTVTLGSKHIHCDLNLIGEALQESLVEGRTANPVRQGTIDTDLKEREMFKHFP